MSNPNPSASKSDATDQKKSNPTKADLEASRRLRILIDRHKREGGAWPKQDELAERYAAITGKGTQGLISQFINGKTALNYNAVLFFAKELQVDPSEIRGDLPEQRLQGRTDDDGEWGDIRATNQEVALGDGTTVSEEYAVTHRLKFRIESLRRKNLRPENLSVVYGRGDSMAPTIKHGDAIMYDTSKIEPEDDGIFVVTYDHQLLAKRLLKFGDAWFIDSDNKQDPKWRKPKPVDDTRGFMIHGKVMWVGSWLA